MLLEPVSSSPKTSGFTKIYSFPLQSKLLGLVIMISSKEWLLTAWSLSGMGEDGQATYFSSGPLVGYMAGAYPCFNDMKRLESCHSPLARTSV